MKARIIAADYWFDYRHGVSTCRRESLDRVRVDSHNREHGNQYEPSRVLPVREFLRRMRPDWPESPVLVDMGCGKGRVLMIASEFGFPVVRGIEFAHKLHEAAKRNCDQFKQATGTETEFDLVHADAAGYTIAPEENVFFFFNPFDDVVMEQVFGNIERSWEQSPRRMLICCYNQPSMKPFTRLRYFHHHADHDYWGYTFAVFQSQSAAGNPKTDASATTKEDQPLDVVDPK